MNEQELISHVEDLGLSNKEAKVYIAALRVGPAAVQQIADLANVKRVTTYVVLESLIAMGLVSQSTKGKKALYTAEPPVNLERLVQKRRRQLEHQETSLAEMLPELMGLTALPKDSPAVKLYEGEEGIRALVSTAYTSLKGDTKIVYGVSNLDQLLAFFPAWAKGGVIQERVNLGIHSKLLYTSTAGASLKADDMRFNRESRFFPAEKYAFKGDINIVGDHVVIISLSENQRMGISIHSAEMAASMKSFFEMAWDYAATLPENK